VSNATGTVDGANITDVGVVCGYSVGGAISGPSGSLVVLQLNGANDLTLGMNRSFAFQVGLTTGTAYNVTLLTVPDGLSCQVVNGSGTIATSPVGDVAVNCREGPTATVEYDVKQVVLNWTAVSGIDLYRVFKSTNNGVSYTQVGADIPPAGPLSYADPVDVHRTDWLAVTYKVQSCVGAVCDDSNVVSSLNSALATGYVKASNTGEQDRFGAALAVSADGNTLAVGAPGDDSGANTIDGDEADDCAGAAANCAGDSGAVFVYVNDNGSWSRQAYVKPANTGTGDQFGAALDMSADGDVLVVGAPFEDSNGSGPGDDSAADSGALYVFTRAGVSWSQQAYLKASNAEAGDNFGHAVALAGVGTTLAAGAPFEDGNGSGGEGDNSALASGAVYVFADGGGGAWSQQAYVKASNAEAGDGFGQTVALADSGNTLAAGAPFEDSSAGGGEGDNSAADSGAAYVFTRAGVSWSPQPYVKAANAETEDNFSRAVALAGDGATLAVGATGEDGAAFPTVDEEDDCEGPAPQNCAEESGAVYVYASVSGAWSPQDYLKASNVDAGDLFGSAIELSVDGGTLAVGAIGEASRSSGVGGEKTDNFAVGSGAVYLFERSASVWSEGAYVKSGNSGEGDNFGQDIGLSGDTGTLVVGAPFEDSEATLINGDRTDDCDAATPANCAEDSGAAYIF
jgi:hypothetical protein